MNPRSPNPDQNLDSAVEALLRSAESDGPSPTSLAKTAAVLGVSVAPFATTTSASAAGAGGSAATVVKAGGTMASSVVTAGSSPTSVLGLSLGFGKLATIGAIVAGGAGVTLSQAWDADDAPPARTSAPADARHPKAAHPPARPAKAASPSASIESPRKKSVPSPQDAPTSRATSSPAALPAPVAETNEARLTVPEPERNETSLARELGLLSQARAALKSGDAGGCLTALDEYRDAFPSGTLSVEAAVLEIEALLVTSGKDAASKQAEAFRRRMPRSMHIERFIALGLLDEDDDVRNAARNQ